MSNSTTPLPNLNSVEGLKKYWDILPEIVQNSLRKTYPGEFAPPKPIIFQFEQDQNLTTSMYGDLPIIVGSGLVDFEDRLKCLVVEDSWYPVIFNVKGENRTAIRFIKKQDY
jgi:hypothetical protein